MDIGVTVPDLLIKHPAVSQVTLTGSRLRGDATEWSDWDFLVETDNFQKVAQDLPTLIKKLEPLSQLWDPLSSHMIYMFILRGPIKVDIVFDLPHQKEPPWTISHDTIAIINNHFWDWILWIACKATHGRKDIVDVELKKMSKYLLEPLGCTKIPDSVEEAVRCFTSTIKKQQNLHGTTVNTTLRKEVINGLKAMGFQV